MNQAPVTTGAFFLLCCPGDRHCERSEAIQTGSAVVVWIASSLALLAMTAESLSNEEVRALEPSFLHIAPQLM